MTNKHSHEQKPIFIQTRTCKPLRTSYKQGQANKHNQEYENKCEVLQANKHEQFFKQEHANKYFYKRKQVNKSEQSHSQEHTNKYKRHKNLKKKRTLEQNKNIRKKNIFIYYYNIYTNTLNVKKYL